MELSEFILTSKLKSVPLVAVSTHDQPRTADTIRSVIASAAKDGKFDYEDSSGQKVKPKVLIILWDMASGARLSGTEESGYPSFGDSSNDPIDFFGRYCLALPEMSTVIALSGHQLIGDPRVVQAFMNLRDEFKKNNRTLVLVGPSFEMPPELRDSFMMIREALPKLEELRSILSEACSGADLKVELTEDELRRASEVLRGMSGFVAEQSVALSIRGGKLDLSNLWALKKEYVRSIKALEWLEGSTKFSDLGGLEGIKNELFTRFESSRCPPNGIVFIDEFDKQAPGDRDDHEATRDLHSVLLGELNKKQFIMAYGVPGAGKTALAIACQKEFERPVLRFDVGAARGSGLYGQAQNEIRNAFELINESMGGNPLYIVTANDTGVLSGPLRNRVENTYFFDLPKEAQRRKIWEIYQKKWPDIGAVGELDDAGWNGRNIEQCAFRAYNYRISLEKAAEAITPVGIFAREKIKRLREQALENGYLDADTGKKYRCSEEAGPVRRSLG